MKYLKIILSRLYISRDFKKKLSQNFHTLTYPEMIIYLIFIRPFWSKQKKFFFEGNLLLHGQMYIGDRKALYDTIIENKPAHCFEIGTSAGGGSTYFLASAFQKIGQGKLITLENDKKLFNKAKDFYLKRLEKLSVFVDFIFGDSLESFKSLLDAHGSVDCFFLDGAEDGKQTEEQYFAFSKYFKKGTIMMAHDWNTEKMINLKPIIMNDVKWEKILELTPPVSIGFVVFKRK